MDQTTEILRSFSCRMSYEDLPPETVHHVKRTLVDTLGCAMGGYLSQPAKISRRLAKSVTSTVHSRILGTADSSTMDMAAFANGVMVRYLDCNDAYALGSSGHPSDMISAALAGDAMGADGRTAITAITLAYEVFCRISDQFPELGESSWDQGIFSAIGAACAAGKVMGLDQDQMAQAISLAAVGNVPLRVTRTGELSMWKGCAGASATRAGVFAAHLASEGMNGPYEPFEGSKGLWESAVGRHLRLNGLEGETGSFRIHHNAFKSYPSRMQAQAAIGLAIELHSQVNLAEVQSIKIRTYAGLVSDPSTEPEKWDPKTRETADHSIPYLVAAGLRDGTITPATFSPQQIQDPGLRSVIARMKMEEDPEFTRSYPAEYNCRIVVTTTSGEELSAHTAYPKGHPRNPMTDNEVDGKFRSLSAEVLTPEQCDRALELMWHLEDQPNLEELFDALVV